MTHPPEPANSGYTPHHVQAAPLPDTSTGWYLNPPTPPTPPPTRWPGWKIALLVAGLLSPLLIFAVIMTAIEDDPAETPTSGIGSPAPYDALPNQQAPTSAGSSDKSGAKACAAVKASNDGPSPFSQEPAAMAAIAVDGKLSINPFIRASSEELAAAARAAVAARGTGDEPIHGIKMGTAALNLETTCIEQRYYPTA